MSSIIEGYNYDIFISYRQKDNKGDRWVSEFVEALKAELESTFKEEISVYFDINPHDGLLETHDVDASLKDKLKCLVFIPIISRTYCDPKSFAWEHEFKVFVEQASKDQFALKVKLPNGNVANRVLPIRIHDLDADDIKLCESIMGGVLRGVEFIYKEPGVNKPLTANDNEKKNLNTTNYKIQINKTANAIKEIVSGLKTGSFGSGSEKTQLVVAKKEVNRETSSEVHEKPVKVKVIKLLSVFLITLILLITAILTYPKIFKRDTLQKLRSSGERITVAVMPFQNMTGDTTKNIWQYGIQNSLTSFLSNSEELKIRQTETINNLLQSKGYINYASITLSVGSSISQKLEANIFIYGNIIQAGSVLRINAQLIDSKTEEVYKSFQKEGLPEKIIPTIDSLSIMIRNFLVVSKLIKQITPDFQHLGSTNSPEAYRYYLNGMNALFKTDFANASSFFLKSLDIDSNFYLPKLSLPFSYGDRGLNEEARIWCLKVYNIKDQLSLPQEILADFIHAYWFETPYEEIKYLKQYLEIDDQSPNWYWHLGFAYWKLQQYDKALPQMEKSLEIYNKWGIKPIMFVFYTFLGDCYHQTGQYKKEKALYIKAEQDFPESWDLKCQQVIMLLAERDTITSNRYIERLISLSKEEYSMSEADISASLADLYSKAGIPEKAEKYYRHALSLEPENPWRLNSLAYFLIENDRNVKEGMDLIDKALTLLHEIKPDDYYFLHTKGWGLYKQGKHKEALEFLQKSWDLKSSYDHDLYLHLEEAKKAVENKK